MVERVDGINQMQNTERINSVSNRETNRNKKNNNRDLLESVKENKLSSDKLKKELEEKIDDMNSIMETLEEKLSFKLHDDTDRIMTQIIDIKTEEVIKEMPPEEMLDLAAKIHEMVGLILDEKV
jgi:flagellar protein FlaG